ncbi:MAG: DUF2834 domain-containing protein [Chromatiales bacterium]|nr:DUF2834 domain-containing protein [Chromatiales bacterium]
MNLKTAFLFFCVIGALLPLSQFAPWLADNGLNLSLFFSELFSTRIGGFFGLDVIISAMVLILFVLIESKRLAMRNAWLPITATLGVGVSLGLPLFLYMRQKHMDAES